MYIYESLMWKTQVQPLSWEDPLENGMATPVFFPGESHGQSSLADYSPWGCKDLDTTERLRDTHIVILQKSTQHHKAIILQIKIN